MYKHVGRQVLCDQCDNRYFNVAHLKEHKEAAHSTGELLHCTSCTYTTASERNLNVHITDQHTEKSVLCTECSFKTNYIRKLKLHKLREHTGQENWPQCSNCDYKNWSSRLIKSHYEKKHEGIRVNCEICSNVFTSKSNMQAHMLKVHKDMLVKLDDTTASMPFHKRYTFKSNGI